MIHNQFDHALFGIHSPDDASSAAVDVRHASFNNIYLAGINVNTATPASSVNTNDYIYCANSVFDFPALTALPTTPQFTNALATDVRDRILETRSIYCYNSRLGLNENVFRQTSDIYSDFSFSQRTKQVGVKAYRLAGATANTFSLLHTGLELSEVYKSMLTLSLNTFTACGKGIEVHGYGIARGSNCCPPPDVSLPLSCNTFDRGGASRPGTAYGIYLAQNSGVSFDPLSVVTPAPPLSNKFFDYSTGRSGFYAIYNGSNTATYWVRYTTFDNYIQPTAPALLSGHSNLNLLCSNVTLYGNGNYTPGQACGVGSAGLERADRTGSRLESSSPNPAADYTTLHYRLEAV